MLFNRLNGKCQFNIGGWISRRDYLKLPGLSGLAVGTSAIRPDRLFAQTVGEGSSSRSSVIDPQEVQTDRSNAVLINGKVIQPQRELPVLTQTDVLVVGGGPAGVVAAIAASRAGSKVTLVERYGYFGGLCTGGLVLLILGHIVKGPKQVCQGIGEEIMRRLDKIDGAIINRKSGLNPTVNAEAVKYLMVEMIEEANVEVFLHCWGVDAIVRDSAVRGVVFECKSCRQVILAKTVIDATGDGDIFACAGAEFEHRSHNIGLGSLVGNMDRLNRSKSDQNTELLGGALPTPIKGVSWINLLGPEGDGLDLATLTRMEMNHRKFIWNNIQKVRKTPGCENIYLLETAPQLGVRITRVLNGLNTVTLDSIKNATRFPDVIGVGGACDAEHGEWQIPYGSLIPRKVDNVIAAGRCISAEIRMADLVRLIPNCFVTGHAAGIAAAVSAKDGCLPRNADIKRIQKILRQQEAYLG